MPQIRNRRKGFGAVLITELQRLVEDWKVKTDKLGELIEWLVRAKRELNGKDDPNLPTYRRVEAAAKSLEKEILELEHRQDAELTGSLERSGPQVVQFEDGTAQTLSADPEDAARGCLIPDDILRVWRIAHIFGGSIVLGGRAERLKFGDTRQIAEEKKTRKSKPKKSAPEDTGKSMLGRD